MKVCTHYSISFMLKQTYISNKYNTTSSILSNTISSRKTIKVVANAICDRSKMTLQFINVLQKCMLQNSRKHAYCRIFIHLFKEWKYQKICSATLFQSSSKALEKMHQHFLKMLLSFTLMCIICIFIEVQ